MTQPKTKLRPASPLGVVAFAVLLALFGAACEDFYTDSLPTPQIALPTPVKLQAGVPGVPGVQGRDLEDLAEARARTALAAALGISADAPRKILFQDATWTDRNPGCYPTPPAVSGPYLIPGYRLLMQYEDIFYEYDTDLGGETGALCDLTLQPVPVEPALDIVTANPGGPGRSDTGAVYVLRSEDDVAEFNSTNSEIAAVAVGVVDWTVEVLVGGWVNIGPETEAVQAYRSPAESSPNSENGSTATNIIIEVAVSESLLADQPDAATTDPTQIWVLVDITEPDSTYEFVVPD